MIKNFHARCATALEMSSDTPRPALGYAGRYAIASVLLTSAGILGVILWS